MSLMTESLLLQAQSLRLEGEIDASIDVLRAVLSQCNSDLRAKKVEEEEKTLRRRHDTQQDNGMCGNSDRRSSGGIICNPNGGSLDIMASTTRQLRQMASYQLALLLLQRSGRSRGKDAKVGGMETSKGDENEADDLLWKLGYRLRLSIKAFGYPLCSCRHYQLNNTTTASSRATPISKIPLAVIDNVLPSSIFDALKHAFRPESRYWSDFYCKANNDSATESISGQQRDVDAQAGEEGISQQKKTNQFASHNIPLPKNSSLPPKSFAHHLQQSKSLLEQVAIITRHRMKERFPAVMNATSVEVWSHRRPPDGQHQLHYDMDEVKLWRQRRESNKCHLDHGKEYGQNNDTISSKGEGGGTKRQKTRHETDNEEVYSEQQKHCEDQTTTCRDIGISCPIISCVLTVDVPNQSETCCHCGSNTHSAPPTIICNQSITRRNGNETNTGYLCYPSPNRLLAFEGSLLHGVIPGIPSVRSSTSSADEDGSSSDDDDFYGIDLHAAKRKPVCGNDQRITLMMGFWGEVCLTIPDETSKEQPMGPNVPFNRLPEQNNWTKEFDPVSISENDTAFLANKSTYSTESEDAVDPLWVSVHKEVITPDDKDFGQYTLCSEAGQPYGSRFFLRSLETTNIDHDVLSGTFT